MFTEAINTTTTNVKLTIFTKAKNESRSTKHKILIKYPNNILMKYPRELVSILQEISLQELLVEYIFIQFKCFFFYIHVIH